MEDAIDWQCHRKRERELQRLQLSHSAGKNGLDDFQRLSDRDFSELEKLGSTSKRPVRFPSKARTDLNRLLARLCTPEGDKLVPAELGAARAALARVERHADKLLATLHEMEVATEPGAALAAWSLFPTDYVERSSTGAALGQPFGIKQTRTLLRTVGKWASRQAHSIEAERSRRKRWNRYFVYVVAEAFEAAGGLARELPGRQRGARFPLPACAVCNQSTPSQEATLAGENAQGTRKEGPCRVEAIAEREVATDNGGQRETTGQKAGTSASNSPCDAG